MNFTIDDYKHRVMTLEENGVVIPVKVFIKTTQPILYIADDQLELKSIEQYQCTPMRPTLLVTDKINSDLDDVNSPLIDRYVFLAKFREPSSNREGMTFYDRKLKDIISIPTLEAITMVSWRQFKNDIIYGYRYGCANRYNSGRMDKTEISLGMDIEEFTPIPEPTSFLGKSHMLDAYGLQPGDTGNHYNNTVYYERPKERNGDEVNFGIQKFQSDTTMLVELGSIADMYPEGMPYGISIHGVTQPDPNYYSAELLAVSGTPTPTDKLYLLLDM